MRHRLRGRSFSRTSAHRKAIFENFAAALLKHEQIMMTLPKAKDLRPIVTKTALSAPSGREGEARCGRPLARDISKR